MKYAIVCFLAWVGLHRTIPAQPLPLDSTAIRDMAQDGAGRIWAIGSEAGLLRWNGRQWQATAVSLPGLVPTDPPDRREIPRAFPLLLQTNELGQVHVLWGRSDVREDAESQYWLTRIVGGESSESVGFLAHLGAAFLSFGADGLGWLTEPGPRVYRVGPGLKVELAWTIDRGQMAGSRFDQYNPVQAVPDAEGGHLLWGEQRFTELATLRGLWRASESGVVALPRIEGLPDRGFSIVAPVESGRLWAGVAPWDLAAGLHEVDLASGHAARVSEPSPDAFAHVLGICRVGMDRYVVSSDRSPNKALWRWREGTWAKVVPVLDSAPFDDYYRISRPFVAGAEGLWIGTGGNGLLFLASSSSGAPEWLDWRRGQPLESVHRIAVRADGGLVWAGFGQGTTQARPEDLRAGRTISPRILDIWKTDANLQVDGLGRLWTLLGLGGEEVALAAWDGEAWTRHGLPAHVRQGDVGFGLGMDHLGRLWVPYRERRWIAEAEALRLTGRVEVFEPAAAQWRPFDSLESALSDLVSLGAHARVDLPGTHQPDFDATGRVCYLGTDWDRRDQAVHYFDGQRWRRWDLGSVGFVRPGHLGQPFFTEEGTLAINFVGMAAGRMTSRFNGQQWLPGPYRSAGPRDPMAYGRRLHAPAGDVAREAGGRVGGWKAERQQLFRSESGISMPQFNLAEVHPFVGARRVDQVWLDAKGNIVLSTALPAGNLSGSRQYVVLAREGSQREARMEWVKAEAGGVELRFGEAEGREGGTGRARHSEGTPRDAGFTAVEVDDGLMILYWTGGGVLEAAERVEGPWREVPGATSPWRVLVEQPSAFYRVRH